MANSLDKNDVEVLKNLKKDSRTPMGSIGEGLNKSKATVSRRVSRMEDEGVIRRYSLDIDYSKLRIMKSLVQIQVIGSPAAIILEQLQKIEEIGRVYKTFGDHNLVCEVFTNSVDELYEMVQSKILKMPSVSNVEVDVIVEDEMLHENADMGVYERTIKE